MASAGTPTPNFPTSLDTVDTFNATDSRFTIVLSAWLTKFWAAIIAMETIIGVTASAVTTTIIYRLANITGGDRAIGASQTVVISNKKLSDSTTTVVANADNTKGVGFSIGGTTGIIGFLATIFTTAKTVTIPDATTTLMGKDTTDVMTNKTYDTAGAGNVFRINGTAISAVTGSGAAVLATNPTLAGATMSGALNETSGTIASAGTTAIGAAASNYLSVTGTTGITAFDTVQAGTRRILTFAGALTLTYNATSMILPSAASIITVAGDVGEFVSLGSGNWKCTNYIRQAGTPLVTASGAYSKGAVAFTTNTTVTHGLGTTPTKIRIGGYCLTLNGSYWDSSYEGISIISGGTIQNSASHGHTNILVNSGTPTNDLAVNTTTGVTGIWGFNMGSTIVLSAVGATTFTVTVTASGGDTMQGHNIIWECFG